MRGSRTSWKSPSSRSRPSSASKASSPTPKRTAPPLEEVDLRAEDDAQIAAELEAEAARKAEEEARAAEEAARKAAEEEEAAAAARSRRRGRRGRREAQARRPAPRWALAPPHRARGPARGHLRPRRGGLRPVAGSRRAGRPDLRRALGGPPPGRDHDRGRPDRDPPRRRRRGRRERLTARPPRSRGGARRTRCVRCARAVGARHACCARRRRPDFWDANFVRVEGDAPVLDADALVRAADELLAGLRGTASSRSRTRPPARRCGRSSRPPAGSPTATR